MTYCLGIIMREGLVMASDSRSNASLDEVNVCQKMHTIVDPGECVFILLTSGNLSCSQSILTLLRRDFDQGKGLASASSMYDAARIVGEQVRTVADMDQPNLNKHNTDIIRFGLGRFLEERVPSKSVEVLEAEI